MNSTFQFPPGVRLKNMKGIREGYQIDTEDEHWQITALISMPHLHDALEALFLAVKCPSFLVIEAPVNAKEENVLRKTKEDPLHRHVYYLDGLSEADVQTVIGQYGRLFINDGMSRFGFGSHVQREEVFVSSFKTILIRSPALESFTSILDGFNIEKAARLRSPFENISRRIPADRRKIEENGISIYEAIEELKEKGLYLAETVPDD